MQNFFFIFIFFNLIFFWFYLLKLSGVKIFTISIPSILILSLIIYQYIGYPFIFFEIDSSRSHILNDKIILWKMFLFTSYSITLIIIGFIFAKKLFGSLNNYNYSKIFSYYKFTNQNRYNFYFKIELILLFFFLIFSLMVLLNWIKNIGLENIPLFHIFDSFYNKNEINYLRSEMTNAYSGKNHYYRFFTKDILSIVSAAFFAVYLTNKNIYNLIFFLFSFTISIFSLLLTTEKGPIGDYLLYILFIYLILNHAGRFSIRSVFYLFIALFSILIFLYVFILDVDTFINAFKKILSRIFLGEIQGLYYYMLFIPEKIDFLKGTSLPNPGGIFSYKPFLLTQEIANYAHPLNFKRGIVGSVPTIYYGEMYANFGYFGVFLPPIFIGLFIYALNILILKIKSSPTVLSFFIWVILYFKPMAYTGLGKYLFNLELIFISIFVFTIILFSQKGKILLN